MFKIKRISSRIISGSFILMAWLAAQAYAADVMTGPVGGNITSSTFKSAALGKEVSYNILLPLDYTTSTDRYPVLYLLHGLGDNHMGWALKTNLSSYAAQWKIIIVMPDAGRSFYVNSGVNAKDRYEDMIVKDLIPFVDSHYRTISLPRSRAVAGLSMGGYGAMFLGLKYSDKFAAIGSFSGALDYARSQMKNLPDLFGGSGADAAARRAQCDPFALLEKVPAGQMPAIYIAVGGQDFLLAGNRAFVDLLGKKKNRLRIPRNLTACSRLGFLG